MDEESNERPRRPITFKFDWVHLLVGGIAAYLMLFLGVMGEANSIPGFLFVPAGLLVIASVAYGIVTGRMGFALCVLFGPVVLAPCLVMILLLACGVVMMGASWH